MADMLGVTGKEARVRSETDKSDNEIRDNLRMASKIAKEVQARARKSHNGKLPPQKKDELERFSDYTVFADSSAWLPYLVYDEKDDDPIRKRRARIMDSVIDMKKSKINTTDRISYEVTKNLESWFEEKSVKAIERYGGLIEHPVRDVGKSGTLAGKVSEMYKGIWSKPENSEKIDAWSKIKTKYVEHSKMSPNEWNEKWETFPEDEKVKGPPEGSDIIILATIYNYKKKYKPTAVIFVTHDSDFAFFKEDIEDRLGIVMVADIRYTGA